MKLRWIGLALALLLPLGVPAQAHDQLVDSSPSQGQLIEAGAHEIALTFAEDLLDLGSGAQIVITGPDSETLVNNGCALIQGAVASTPVELDQPGKYLVGWRVVSGDGHPISGTFTFQVENTTGFQKDPNFQDLACSDAITQETYSSAQEPSSLNYWLLFGSLTIVAGGLFLFLRPRNNLRSSGPKGQD